MTLLSCPQMLRLGRLLVDAYRRYDDTAQASGVEGDIYRVHEQIATHRRSCEMCKKIALPKSKDDPSALVT